MLYAIIPAGIAIAILAWTMLPTIYNKHFNKSVLKRLQDNRLILLTFDDGPDRRYTDHLLNLLSRHGIHAIFFVVAKTAEENSAIIERMKLEGHEVALHSKAHKNAWGCGKKALREEIGDGIRILTSLGCNIKFMRPPWGRSNPYTNGILRSNKLTMMLWDVMAEDWQASATANSISERILSRTVGGSIICLHDAGEETGGASAAPLKMIKGLEAAIPLLLQKGYRFADPCLLSTLTEGM